MFGFVLQKVYSGRDDSIIFIGQVKTETQITQVAVHAKDEPVYGGGLEVNKISTIGRKDAAFAGCIAAFRVYGKQQPLLDGLVGY